MVRLALGIIRMSVGKWVLYTPVKLNLTTRERFSAGTQKRVESINAVQLFSFEVSSLLRKLPVP